MIKQVVSNGCSWMFGMGVTAGDCAKLGKKGGRQENRVSGLFAQKYNAKDINLSIPGGSNDRILRTITEWLFQNQKRTLRTQKSRYFSETFVLIGLTQIPRNELWFHSNPDKHRHSKWVKMTGYPDENTGDKSFYKFINLNFRYFHTFQYDYERTLRNIIQLASVCEYYGCKYLIFDAIAGLELWSLNGYEKATENYFHSKSVEWDYTNPFIEKLAEVSQDRHYDYNKRSLEDIIKSNPNIYLDTTWDQFLGGANGNMLTTKELPTKKFVFPKGWKWIPVLGKLDNDIYNKDGLYALNDSGHPSAKGNYMWYKHLEKYIEKNKIM